MSERSGFFNAEIDSNGQYDRTYKAEQFAEYFSAFIGNGVYITPASQLKVIPVGNELAIYISVGNAYINGYFYANDDKIYRKLSNPNGVNPRIDRVVLRLNFKTRKISVDILEGTAASNPSAKGITRSQDVYELAIADVYIASNAITVTEANITDLRNNSLMCGYVKGVVDQIDTTNLFSQFQNSFDTWFANIKSQLSGDVAANLQRQIDENRERLSFNANKKNATNLKDTLESPMLVTNATRNLLNPTLATTTRNGVTCTNNGDGTYTLNGTNTLSGNPNGTIWISIASVTLPNQKAVLLGSNNPEVGVYVSGETSTMFGDGSIEILESDYGKTVNFGIAIAYKATLDNVVVKPMLTTDLSATYDDFVPYDGYDIKTCGKNLLNYLAWSKNILGDSRGTFVYENNGVTITATENDAFTGFGTGNTKSNITVHEGEIITLSWEANNNLSGSIYIFPNGKTVTDGVYKMVYADNESAKKITYTVPAGVTFIQFRFGVLNAGASISYKNIQIERGSARTEFEQYQDGGTVHIDSTTEFPLLGLKSFDGETNIISPGNVEVTYATSKGGKGFLESLLANSNIKDELDAKIKENTNQINANKQQLTTLSGTVLPELSSLIDNVAFKENMRFSGVDNSLNLQIIQEGLFITKGAMTNTSNTYLVGCVARSLLSATLTTEPVVFASFDMNNMFESGLITRAYFNKPAIALPGEQATARIQIMDEDLEIGARTVNVAIVGAQATNIQASVPFMINNLEIIAVRQTQSASQASAQPASRIRRIPKSKINEISLMSLDDEIESNVSTIDDEQFIYDEETLALMEKLDNDPNWTRIIFKN